MKRVLAIFRKDVRRLWPFPASLMALLALNGALDPFYTRHHPPPYLEWTLPLACWIIILGAIHQERLPGHRQYWLTRPCTWKDVLAAKALFVLAFVNVPLLLLDLIVWVALGISPLQHVSVLLRTQMFFTAVYILPAAALAAITRNTGEAILTALVTALAAGAASVLPSFLPRRGVWLMDSWLPIAALLAIGCGLVLLVQYSRRRTGVARALIACTLVAFVLVGIRGPGGQLFARPPEGAGVRIVRDDSRRVNYRRGGGGNFLLWDVPIRFEGLPPGDGMFTNLLTTAVDGTRSNSGQLWANLTSDHFKITYMEGPQAQIERTGVTVYGTAEVTVFRRRQSVPAPKAARVEVPESGACSAHQWHEGYEIVCYTPHPRLALFAESGPGPKNWIIPYGLAAERSSMPNVFHPLEKHTTQLSYPTLDTLAGVNLVTAEPVTRVKVAFQIATGPLGRR